MLSSSKKTLNTSKSKLFLIYSYGIIWQTIGRYIQISEGERIGNGLLSSWNHGERLLNSIIRMQTSHEPFIIIRIFALHNLLQKSSRDTFFSITFSCTESRSKDHCSVWSLFLSQLCFELPVFLFLLILFTTSSLTSYSPLVLLFYSAGLYTSGFSPLSGSLHKKQGLHSSQIQKIFFGRRREKPLEVPTDGGYSCAEAVWGCGAMVIEKGLYFSITCLMLFVTVYHWTSL